MTSPTLTPPADPAAFWRTFRAAHPAKTLAFDDWRWPYLTAGQGPRTLLLLPGAFVGAEMWFYLLTTLSDRYRLIAPELPAKALSLAETEAALLKLLAAEGVEQVVLLGYSAGGGLAQVFVQAHPERVVHLILSHCTPLTAAAAHRVARTGRLLRFLPLPLIRAILGLRSSRYPANWPWAKFARAFFAERVAQLDRATLANFFEAGTTAALAFQFAPTALQDWPGKILLLSSKDDATTFRRLPELQTRYPTAQTQVLEQGGHHTVLLFPENYVAALTTFLNTLP